MTERYRLIVVMPRSPGLEARRVTVLRNLEIEEARRCRDSIIKGLTDHPSRRSEEVAVEIEPESSAQ